MKSFKKLISEVAQPKSEDEKNFKDKHVIEISPHPVATDSQHTGDTTTGVINAKISKPKKHRRPADYKKGEDEAVYEGMDLDGEGLAQRLDRARKMELKQKIYDEAKLDPVGQEDDDIDNDGDVDDSDAYLHNRRKVIKKAMKESLEKITEKAKSEAQQKAAAIALAVKRGEKPKSELFGAAKEMYKMSEKDLEDYASTKHDDIPYKVDEATATSYKTYEDYVKANKAKGVQVIPRKLWNILKNESVELDEATAISYKTYEDYIKANKAKGVQVLISRKLWNILKNESVELDESNQMSAIGRKLQQLAPKEKNDTISNAMAKLGDHLESYGTTFGPRNMKELEKKTGMKAEVIQMLIKRAGGTVNENMELTEISKKTLGSYIKGAAHDSKVAVSDYSDASRYGTAKDSAAEVRRMRKRGQGIERAVNKLTKEAVELDELSKDTLMSYRGSAKINRRQNDEIIGSQMATNKQASKAERNIKKRSAGIDLAARKMRKEEFELDEAKTDIYHKHMLKALAKSRLPKDHQYTSSIANNGDFVVFDGSSRIVGRIKKGEHDLKESAFVAKAAYAKKDNKKSFELGKKKFPVTIKKDVADEITEDLTENFKTGSVKLNDGSSVLLKKQDADLMNQMFADLNPGNRKKMMKVAMTDKAGFEEILGFAREAM